MPSSSQKESVDISGLVEDLESIAMDFQTAMYHKNLVKDRKMALVAYPQSFVGRDAIDVLVEVLREELDEEPPPPICDDDDDSESNNNNNPLVTREVALAVGRAIAEEFQLFQSAFVLKKIDHELSDDKSLYQWRDNLPSDVAQITYHMSLKDKVLLLKKYVPIRDRFFRLKTYPRCFVGSDAVDVLMKHRIVISRKDAVKLIRQMKIEYKCFYTIVSSDNTKTKSLKRSKSGSGDKGGANSGGGAGGETSFADSKNCYYRFKMDEQIMKNPDKAKDLAFHCVIDALTGNESNTTEFQLASMSFHDRMSISQRR